MSDYTSTYTEGTGDTIDASDFSTEFDAIEAAIATKADVDGDTITGATLTTATLTSPTITTPTITGTIAGTPTITSPVINEIDDANGNEVLSFSTSGATAVTYIDIRANDSGIAPFISAKGEANRGMALFDSNNAPLLDLVPVASAVNYFQVYNNATGNNPAIFAVGSDTDVSVNFVPKNAGEVLWNGTRMMRIGGTAEAAWSSNPQVLTTAVPTWATKIEIVYANLSTNSSTGTYRIAFGDGDYDDSVTFGSGLGPVDLSSGIVTLHKVSDSSNIWVTGGSSLSDDVHTLGGDLSQIRLSATTGTPDSGSVIVYWYG